MNQRERIEKDIQEFFAKISNSSADQDVKDIAIRYANDASYYLERGDYFTAWGCINYAFGLIDAFKYSSKKKC